MEKQCTSHLFMVRPVQFGFNADAAESNAFMENPETRENPQHNALRHFDDFVDHLRRAEVDIYVFTDRPDTYTPDSIFPNNWVSLHADGRVILYPMEPENRRLERRMDLIEQLSKDFCVDEIIDLSHLEQQGIFLEGTGSIVLDRSGKKAYVCLSSRSNERALDYWHTQFPDYELIIFEGVDRLGIPIYHTNVMMCVAEDFAVVCLEALRTPLYRELVTGSLTSSGKEILEISFEQMESFAGNMLQVENKLGDKLLVMSQTAFNSLNEEQISFLRFKNELIIVELGLIETLGGGSARCMLAEIHLPLRDKPL